MDTRRAFVPARKTIRAFVLFCFVPAPCQNLAARLLYWLKRPIKPKDFLRTISRITKRRIMKANHRMLGVAR